MEQPRIIVIGGPNGAGKSTMATFLVPDGCPFLNADEIATELDGDANILAGKLFFREWDRLHLARQSFAVESTLAGKAMARRIEKLKADGYFVDLYFVWSPAVELNIARVALRVQSGGHDVQEDTIRRRYVEGLRNLFELYMPLASRWRFLYNVRGKQPQVIARWSAANGQRIYHRDYWAMIQGSLHNA